MDSVYEEETDFEDEEFFSPQLLFSFPVIINGNKTEVIFNCCSKGAPDEYYAVNLVRNGSCVNSFTMASSGKPAAWKFQEDSVPRELRDREQEFSASINKARG